MRAALYARISTDDERQNLDNQLIDLREYAERSRWEITSTFTDSVSGAADNRPGLEQLMREASRKRFDVVLVWDLSRLTRKGPYSALQIVERLKASGIELHSYREEQLRAYWEQTRIDLAAIKENRKNRRSADEVNRARNRKRREQRAATKPAPPPRAEVLPSLWSVDQSETLAT